MFSTELRQPLSCPTGVKERSRPRRSTMSFRAAWRLATPIVIAIFASLTGAAAPPAPAQGRAFPDQDRPCPVAVSPNGGDSPLLLKRTDVRVKVTGPIAHAVITQIWENPNTRPVAGLYIFPLPQNAAVSDMQLKVGERLIRAEMRLREDARGGPPDVRCACVAKSHSPILLPTMRRSPGCGHGRVSTVSIACCTTASSRRSVVRSPTWGCATA